MTNDVVFIADDVIDDVTCQIRVLSDMTSSVAADCQPVSLQESSVTYYDKQNRAVSDACDVNIVFCT